METRLLECEICGWLADEGDEGRYCQQHKDAMGPLLATMPPLDPRLTEGQQRSLRRRWAAKSRILGLI